MPRLASALIAGALVLTAAVAGAVVQPAQATEPKPMSVSPASGTSGNRIDLSTIGKCATGTHLQVKVTGSGFPEAGFNVSGKVSVTGDINRGSYYFIPLLYNMADFAAQQSPPATLTGEYVFSAYCYPSGLSNTPVDSFRSSIWFTTPSAYQSEDPASAGQETSLEVSVDPQYAYRGDDVTITATVTPAEATGSVEFTALAVGVVGAQEISLGVADIDAGIASLTYAELAGGAGPGIPQSYTITATYVPDSERYLASEATTPLLVEAESAPTRTADPVVTAARVGVALTCTTGTWTGAQSYTISVLVAGDIKVQRSNAEAGQSVGYTPGAADAGKALTCAVVARARFGTTTEFTTAAKTVQLGAAPTAVTNRGPRVTGSATVGKILTVSRGTWSPSNVTVTYQWVVITGSKSTPIAGAKTDSLRLTAAQRGKVVGVVVTAKAAGRATGSVTVRAPGTVR